MANLGRIQQQCVLVQVLAPKSSFSSPANYFAAVTWQLSRWQHHEHQLKFLTFEVIYKVPLGSSLKTDWAVATVPDMQRKESKNCHQNQTLMSVDSRASHSWKNIENIISENYRFRCIRFFFLNGNMFIQSHRIISFFSLWTVMSTAISCLINFSLKLVRTQH